jgi:hypothetical protein
MKKLVASFIVVCTAITLSFGASGCTKGGKGKDTTKTNTSPSETKKTPDKKMTPVKTVEEKVKTTIETKSTIVVETKKTTEEKKSTTMPAKKTTTTSLERQPMESARGTVICFAESTRVHLEAIRERS